MFNVSWSATSPCPCMTYASKGVGWGGYGVDASIKKQKNIDARRSGVLHPIQEVLCRGLRSRRKQHSLVWKVSIHYCALCFIP